QGHAIDKGIGYLVGRLPAPVERVELALPRFVPAQSASPGRHPQTRVPPFDQRFDRVVGKTKGVHHIVPEDRKLVAVITVKPILRTQPDKAALGLQETGHVALGKAVDRSQPAEFYAVILSGYVDTDQQ